VSLRVAVVGLSIDDPCGVRDHAAILAEALAEADVSCSLHWLSRTAGTLGGERAEVRAWGAALARTFEREPPDAVLLHYSVFAYSHRGVPLLARPVLDALRRSGAPLVAFMHEYAYPWRLGGARGKVWAATQRFVLRRIVADASAIVVTADARAAWLASRAWLARRPIAVAPVFSNLPVPSERPPAPVSGRLGLFGFAHEGVDVETVLDALRALRARGGELELMLLGAPGRSSAGGERWQRAAAERGLAAAIGFSGRLPAGELAAALGECEVLLFAERGGATSRKTTLAASLSSGRPLVALDGPNGWSQLARSRAAVIVPPWSQALADAISKLLDDADACERQGELGRAFAERSMSVASSAQTVAATLSAAVARSHA
jgi:glycosyltransferase involved in cell wall biosynthesis